MPHIIVETAIAAPIELCFDLARDLRVHAQTTVDTRERILAGPESGLMELGDEVTFEAVHFGIRQRLTSKIVVYDRPHEFVDEMQRGAFRSMRHVHRFAASDAGTLMTDVVDFESPAWILGKAVDALFLARYLRTFLKNRAEALKKIAEGFGGTETR